MTNNNSPYGSELLKISVAVMIWIIIPLNLTSYFTDIRYDASFQVPSITSKPYSHQHSRYNSYSSYSRHKMTTTYMSLCNIVQTECRIWVVSNASYLGRLWIKSLLGDI
jgi:hypothetical protein